MGRTRLASTTVDALVGFTTGDKAASPHSIASTSDVPHVQVAEAPKDSSMARPNRSAPHSSVGTQVMGIVLRTPTIASLAAVARLVLAVKATARIGWVGLEEATRLEATSARL